VAQALHAEVCEEALVSCEHKNHGCGESGKRVDIAKHETRCRHRPHPCQHCGEVMPLASIDRHVGKCPKRTAQCTLCQASMTADALEHHVAEVCQAKETACELCHRPVRRDARLRHDEVECPATPAECPHAPACQATGLTRSTLQAHVSGECAERPVPCAAGCGVSVAAARAAAHAEDDCPMRAIQCPRGCGDAITAASEARHLAKDCDKRPVKCHRCDTAYPLDELAGHMATGGGCPAVEPAVKPAVKPAAPVAMTTEIPGSEVAKVPQSKIPRPGQQQPPQQSPQQSQQSQQSPPPQQQQQQPQQQQQQPDEEISTRVEEDEEDDEPPAADEVSISTDSASISTINDQGDNDGDNDNDDADADADADAAANAAEAAAEAREKLAALRPSIGMRIALGKAGDPGQGFIVVTECVAGGAAASASLAAGDIIESVNGIAAVSTAAFLSAVRGRKPGERLEIVRGEGKAPVSMMLGAVGMTAQELEQLVDLAKEC
jgi:hypothetical protein